MKKNLLLLTLFLASSIVARAQLSDFNVGINGNYTSYIKPTPGAQLRIGYDIARKYGVSLGVSYGLPVKEVTLNNGFEDKEQAQYGSANLAAIYHLIGSTENNFSFYLPFGVSYVMASNVSIFEGVTKKTKESGLTVNAGIGTQFKIGLPVLFAEAGVALPAGTTYNTRDGAISEGKPNPIPLHSILSLGIKFPLGFESNGYGF